MSLLYVSKADKFKNYLNSINKNIQFEIEHEKD